MIRYCTACVLPESRPHLKIGADGVCIACRRHRERSGEDWRRRRADFAQLVSSVKRRRRDYDCVIPVSGGKDSTWQVIKCLEFGLRPLAVSWRPPARTALGQSNLENLIRLGVDHIDFSIDPDIERRFMLKTFKRAGSPAIPMHLAIFAIPQKIAVSFNVPLIVWGENSAREYGGEDADAGQSRLNSDWIMKYGVTQGTSADEWADEDLPEEALSAYRPPSDELLRAKGVQGIFLGHYFPWDPIETLRVSLNHGFQPDQRGPKTGSYNFADIDDDFISLHHWVKWFKYGFTRTFDNLSLEIRNGRLSRHEAIEILGSRGDETPWMDLATFSHFSGESMEFLLKTAESFRNPEVWERGTDGIWRIPTFPVPSWDWRTTVASGR